MKIEIYIKYVDYQKYLQFILHARGRNPQLLLFLIINILVLLSDIISHIVLLVIVIIVVVLSSRARAGGKHVGRGERDPRRDPWGSGRGLGISGGTSGNGTSGPENRKGTEQE